jgi:hypothetical protein
MEDNLLEKPKKRKSYYKRKTPKPAVTEPEVSKDDETIPPPALPIDMHRENLKSDVITMGAVIPSVGPSLSDNFIQHETKEPGITMQNTVPASFPWRKPKEKKTSVLPMITMSSLRPRKAK